MILKINNIIENLLGKIIIDGYEGPCFFIYFIILAYASIYYHAFFFVGFGFLFLILTINAIADEIKKKEINKKIKEH